MMREDNRETPIDTTLQAKPASEFSFDRISLNNWEEYVDFLIEAHRGRFNYDKFLDREFVKRSWRWEYVDNPAVAGKDPLIWVCRKKGKIISQVCFMPVGVSIKGKACKGCWCQDIMILPEFRNMGMGYFLIRHALGELAGYADLVMVSGTNPASYALLRNIGFTDLGFIGKNIKCTLFDHLVRKKYEKDGTIKIYEVEGFDERFDRLWRDLAKKIPCIVIRDKSALNWRYVQNPYFKYRVLVAEENNVIKGYIVYRKGALKRGVLSSLKIGIVSDILFDPDNKDVGLLLLRKFFAILKGETSFYRWDVLHEAFKPIIKSSGFFSIKSTNKYMVYPIATGSDEAVKSSKEWYLTFGDSDLDLS